MSDFQRQMRAKYPSTAEGPSLDIGYRQIELQIETNRLLSEILDKLPAFSIVPREFTQPDPFSIKRQIIDPKQPADEEL